MPTLSQNANFYRVALIMGVVDATNVIAWADAEIEASTIPPNPLIEVSLGRSLATAAMVSHLADLTENPHDRWSIHRAFGLVADRIRTGGISVESAIMNCYRFLQFEELLYDREFDIFITYEDDLSLIRDGIFSADKMAGLEAGLLNTLDAISASAGNLR